MNLQACTFEKLPFISLGFGTGAQVGEKFTFRSIRRTYVVVVTDFFRVPVSRPASRKEEVGIKVLELFAVLEIQRVLENSES